MSEGKWIEEGKHEFKGDKSAPHVLITEQPQSRNIRFRYKSEGLSHGGIQGVYSTRENKTYPAVEIIGYSGPARVTAELVNYIENLDVFPHPHKLVGKNCENGICTALLPEQVTGSMVARFPNMSVEHATKKNILTVLEEQVVASKRSQYGLKTGQKDFHLTAAERTAIHNDVKQHLDLIQLNVVHICWKAYLPDVNGNFTVMLNPVYSNPIYDSKSPSSNQLKICRMSRGAGSCTGGDEVFLLCEKVPRDDVNVLFYEIDPMNRISWQQLGKFGPSDVHRQCCIVFRTPPYWNTDIQQAINVNVRLIRKSDPNDVSDSVSFTYYPQADHEEIMRKRKKKIDFYSNTSVFTPIYKSAVNENLMDRCLRIRSANGHASRTIKTPDPDHIEMMNSGLDSGIDSIKDKSSHVRGSRISKGALQSNAESDSASFARGMKHLSLGGETDTTSYDSKTEQRGKNIETSGIAHWFAGSKQQAIDIVHSRKDGYSQTESRNVDDLREVTDEASMMLAKRMSNALQKWAVTGDTRHLVYTARYLIATQDSEGDTALGLAILNNQVNICKILIEVALTISDWDVLDIRNESGQTYLHLCVMIGCQQILQELLISKANPTLLDCHGNLPAHLAARYNKPECLIELLQYKDYTCPRTLNEKSWLNSQNHEGLSILHEAVKAASFKCVKACVEAGIDVNIADQTSRRTALHYAVNQNNCRIVSYLLSETDVDIDAVDLDGRTCLHIAAMNGLNAIVALLMTADANPQITCAVPHEATDEEQDLDRWTPLEFAQFMGHEKIVDIITHYDDLTVIKSLRPEKIYRMVQRDEESGKIPCDSHVTQTALSSSVLQYEHHRAVRVDSLTARLWNDIAKLLDVEDSEKKNWKNLAVLLNFRNMEEQLRKDESPTKAILNLYRKQNGTIGLLTDKLEQMGRIDVALQIKKEVQEKFNRN
ncbi:nuclear factor NF-kappa-B p105 subunit-like [Tubulanus polymorphus]|uniref:nuclear factor NF-kappa-B p105 subunit-like n=1 Tax=Tubulanus polymorphus TaxID=672921 RepID=UPI003DA59B32